MQKNLKTHIRLKNAHTNNLKNIHLSLPKNKLIVITGVSGSGKSSLAFDTIHAEGQRRYVESLSSYARQFLGKIEKPKVEKIEGITPVIATAQKVNIQNPRSTVGSSTEIYDYLKLLFARIGKTYDPITKKQVKKDNTKDVLNYLKKQKKDNKMLLLAALDFEEKTAKKTLERLVLQGYVRLFIKNKMYRINDLFFKKYNEKDLQKFAKNQEIFLVIERIIIENSENFFEKLHDSIALAFFEGKGHCAIFNKTENKQKNFSNLFESNGTIFTIPSTDFFSFNNPYGACPTCEGYGSIMGISEALVIPDTHKSIYEEAIAPWRTKSTLKYKNELINNAHKYEIPIHKAWFELSEKHKKIIWNGTKDFVGIYGFFEKVKQKSYKIQNRVFLSRYRGKSICPTCEGSRLKKETAFVKIQNKSIVDLVEMPIENLCLFFENVTITNREMKIAERILEEIKTRLHFLKELGLGYLTLNRNSNTLSGGETQRINLAACLGNKLVGSTYILDEPSVGLHPRDTEKLIRILKYLRDLGNTIIVVEHDSDMMKQADYIVDIGPMAGALGGEIVAAGNYSDFIKKESLTAKFLDKKLSIQRESKKPFYEKNIEIIGAKKYNLKNINVKIQLNVLNVITGVSGSGKSTFAKEILYPALQEYLKNGTKKSRHFLELKGNLEAINKVLLIDKNPLGRSSRSNPITYLKIYDSIRTLYSLQKKARLEKLAPKHFSFNVEAGRCPECKGEGKITVAMQFMADVHLTCEVCEGKMFQESILEVFFEGKNIYDLLETTVDEAIIFFEKHHKKQIHKQLIPLQKVGLGYLKLGQACTTLSGGEAQRLKLASFLGNAQRKEKILFIFDEPTNGLHFHDVQILLNAFDELLKQGHHLVVVEHNTDLIKCADNIIDLGVEGGAKGGNLIFQGSPQELIKCKKSLTGKYLAN